jgi:ATP-dependent Clp protease protease subunit
MKQSCHTNLIKEITMRKPPQQEGQPSIYRQGRSLYFFDEINNFTVAEALRLLQLMVNEAPKKSAQIILNTPGGSVYDGLCFYDYLRYLSCPLIIIGTGLVASMGVIIILAGDKRYVTKNTRLMSHQISSQVQGKVSDIKIDYDETKELEKICDGIIAERTGQSLKAIQSELKKGDKYFGAEEALKRGYIQKIV